MSAFDPVNDEYDRGFQHGVEAYKPDLEFRIQQLESYIGLLQARLRVEGENPEQVRDADTQATPQS